MTTSAYAPGRVELLGNHTDYNHGLVLAAAIDRGLTVSGESRSEAIAELRSATLGRAVRLSLSDVVPQIEERWANYSLGVVSEFLAAGFPLTGFSAEITGDLPPGSGLSSSASLEVATARFLMKLNGIELPLLNLAKLCQRAENRFVGVQSGLLDQVTCIFGRENHVVLLDCRSEEIRTLPFPADVALIIADSGKKHSLVHGEYNARREECAAAARALGVDRLRDVSTAQLEESRSKLDPVVYRRAAHVIGETERVACAAECIGARDMPALGALMNDSHESSRTNFENSSPEQDELVEIARAQPGVFGARLTGGGFGGATVALAQAAQADVVSAAIASAYASRTGCSANVSICRLADGAK